MSMEREVSVERKSGELHQPPELHFPGSYMFDLLAIDLISQIRKLRHRALHVTLSSSQGPPLREVLGILPLSGPYLFIHTLGKSCFYCLISWGHCRV